MAAHMRLVFAVQTLEKFVLNQHARSLQHNLSAKSIRNFSSARSFLNQRRLLVAGSVAAVGLTLTAIVHQRWLPYWQTVEAASSVSIRPQIQPSRRVKIKSDNSGLKLTLFQFQTCPFCCKVRAVLDYYGFSYNVVEVNSVTKKQLKWSQYKKVPIVLVDGVGANNFLQLNDSSVIISVLESWLHDREQSLEGLVECYPCIESEERGKKVYDYPNKYFIMFHERADLSSTPQQRQEERRWRKWADDHLVHMLSPNVYRTPSEALQAFRYFSDVGEWDKVFSKPERLMVIYTGATVMYLLGRILRKKYNLKEDVRESLYEACKEWTRAVGRQRRFLGGHQPNLADLSVYGVLSSIEGCQAFQEAQANTNIGEWYGDMQRAVRSHQGAYSLTATSVAKMVTIN